ncbi:MAG TPA: single-stranded-DNA-specific exonuclease RecJ, partial [Flavobacterium sp.]|nr:single-stranded-DNA-specific exonuclease RecJ [Flavobacterium sp.]
SGIDQKFVNILKQFEPFGPGNMNPVFAAKGLFDTGFGRTIGQDGKHLKLFVKQGSRQFPAIGFGLADKLPLTENRQPFEAAFCVEESEWNGNRYIQLRLKDIR